LSKSQKHVIKKYLEGLLIFFEKMANFLLLDKTVFEFSNSNDRALGTEKSCANSPGRKTGRTFSVRSNGK
jgi:hypothetical protein